MARPPPPAPFSLYSSSLFCFLFLSCVWGGGGTTDDLPFSPLSHFFFLFLVASLNSSYYPTPLHTNASAKKKKKWFLVYCYVTRSKNFLLPFSFLFFFNSVKTAGLQCLSFFPLLLFLRYSCLLGNTEREFSGYDNFLFCSSDRMSGEQGRGHIRCITRIDCTNHHGFGFTIVFWSCTKIHCCERAVVLSHYYYFFYKNTRRHLLSFKR